MNIFVVAEGKSEKFIYKKWIPCLNPTIAYVDSISEISNNHFSIVSNFGYPKYFDAIDDAILDVNAHGGIDRLVISIDSEDMSFDEKENELLSHLSNTTCNADIKVIIQHFCIETWALANRRICSPNINDPAVKALRRRYDVRLNDPELLPSCPYHNLNRAQFAYAYLHQLFLACNSHISYSKGNPKPLCTSSYFKQVNLRFQNTGHIPSFHTFIAAFS